MAGKRAKEIELRCVQEAEYALENYATIRQTSKKFGVSKSTTHKDFIKVLPEVNSSLAVEISALLELNKERARRGGNANKLRLLRGTNKHPDYVEGREVDLNVGVITHARQIKQRANS